MKKWNIILLTFIVLSLFMIVYIVKDDFLKKSANHQSLTIELSIQHENGYLSVSEIVTPHEHGQAFLVKPDQDVTIFMKDQDEKKVYNKQSISFTKNEPVEFYYEYPIQCETCVIDQYIIRFFDKSETILAANYQVSISEPDETMRWFSGSLAHETLRGEFSTLYSWQEETKQNVPLFMTKGTFIPYKEEKPLSIYYEEDASGFEPIDESFISKYSTQQHLTILLTNKPFQYSGEDLLIFSKDTSSNEYKRLFLQAKHQIKQFEQPELSSLFISILLDEPILEKEEALFSELKTQLQPEEWLLFQKGVSQLMREKSSFSYQQLDEVISETMGKKTTFFHDNKDGEKMKSPLYFQEHKEVWVNDKKINSNWLPISYHGNYYLPVKEVADYFDFYIEELTNSNTIYFSKGSQMIYLPLDGSYEAIQPNDYEIEEIGETVYVSGKTLQTYFDIFVYERNGDFYLTN